MLQLFIDTIPKTVIPARDYSVLSSHELISLIQSKDTVRLKRKNAKCPKDKAALNMKYSDLRKSVKYGIKSCFDDYVKDCEDKMKTNTKCFFAFTKSLKRTNSLPNSNT